MMSKEEAEITVPNKGRVALLIFAATLVTAAFLPDLTGAIMLGGSLAMMLTGILTTEEAYTSIGWKTVLRSPVCCRWALHFQRQMPPDLSPLKIVGLLGGYGGAILLAGLFLTTVLLTQAVNGAVAAAILGPVAIRLAQQSNINPRSMVMGVALASSMAFITPLSHPVNVLVMSPGGYTFRDYLKVGLPLTLLLFVVMIVLPLFWPL